MFRWVIELVRWWNAILERDGAGWRDENVDWERRENTESGCTLAQPHPYESLLEVEKRVNLQIKSQSFWGELSLDSGHRRKAQHFLTSSSPSNPPLNVCFRYVCNDWEGKAQRFRFSFSRHRMTIWYGWPCLSLPSFLGRLSTFHPSSVLSSRLFEKKRKKMIPMNVETQICETQRKKWLRLRLFFFSPLILSPQKKQCLSLDKPYTRCPISVLKSESQTSRPSPKLFHCMNPARVSSLRKGRDPLKSRQTLLSFWFFTKWKKRIERFDISDETSVKRRFLISTRLFLLLPRSLASPSHFWPSRSLLTLPLPLSKVWATADKLSLNLTCWLF